MGAGGAGRCATGAGLGAGGRGATGGAAGFAAAGFGAAGLRAAGFRAAGLRLAFAPALRFAPARRAAFRGDAFRFGALRFAAFRPAFRAPLRAAFFRRAVPVRRRTAFFRGDFLRLFFLAAIGFPSAPRPSGRASPASGLTWRYHGRRRPVYSGGFTATKISASPRCTRRSAPFSPLPIAARKLFTSVTACWFTSSTTSRRRRPA